MAKKVIKASDNAIAALILEDDKIHVRSGANFVTISNRGIVESGKKVMLQGESDTTHAGLTKGTMDLLNILPSMIVLPKPQRIPNIPIMPILSLVEMAGWAAALSVAMYAAGKAG